MKLFIVIALLLVIGIESHSENDHHHDQHDHENCNHHSHSKHEKKQVKKKEEIEESSFEKVLGFLNGCHHEIEQWIILPEDIQDVVKQCEFEEKSKQLILLYEKIKGIGQNFTIDTVQLISKEIKMNSILVDVLNCFTKNSKTENQYLNQKRKLKHLSTFLKKHPSFGRDCFPFHSNYTLIGQKMCKFFKSFFQFYYLQIFNPSQTLASDFLRALTVRSPIFSYQDISSCISLDSVADLSTALEDIDINNIFVKIPVVFKELKFLKLRQGCKDQHRKQLIGNLRIKLEGLDMFKIMYKEYEPFVEVAAEKMGQTQVRMLARKFAEIIKEKQRYLQYSKQVIAGEL